MAVRRDLSNLPSAGDKPARPPSKNSIIVQPVAEAWHRQYLASGDDEYLPAIAGRRFRASWAGMRCDRQVFYAMAGVERSEPLSMASVWRMKLGNLVHDELGNLMDALGDGWRTEIIVDLMPHCDGSAHADLARFTCRCGAPIACLEVEPTTADDDGPAILTMRCGAACPESETFTIERTAKGEHTWSPEHEVAADVCEFKTQGGYGFKMAASTFKGPPEGPRYGHIIQGAMCADALGCDRLTIAYIAMENLSPNLATAYGTSDVGRFAAEWHFSVATLRPHLDREYARVARLLRYADAGRVPIAELVEPDYPVGAVLVDPPRQRWELRDERGTIEQFGSHPWICSYCDWRTTCTEQGPDASATDEVTV